LSKVPVDDEPIHGDNTTGRKSIVVANRQLGIRCSRDNVVDRVDKKTRSRIMSAVGTQDTGPEMVVRRMLHKMGYRYGLHDKRLPGCPDIVFSSRRKIIFVHGCFWHRHNCRYGRCLPGTRRRFWQDKFDSNKRRDRRAMRQLRAAGWQTLVVWQCQTKKARHAILAERLSRFVSVPNKEAA
jgi:DNA mismatch endonuclease (patch repair protein)